MNKENLKLVRTSMRGAGLFEFENIEFWMKPAQTNKFIEEKKITNSFKKNYEAQKSKENRIGKDKSEICFSSVEAETEKAILLKIHASYKKNSILQKFWFPKSEIKMNYEKDSVVMSSWLISKLKEEIANNINGIVARVKLDYLNF